MMVCKHLHQSYGVSAQELFSEIQCTHTSYISECSKILHFEQYQKKMGASTQAILSEFEIS